MDCADASAALLLASTFDKSTKHFSGVAANKKNIMTIFFFESY